MSFFDERRSELVLDLRRGRISELDFAERFPMEAGAGSEFALSILRGAVRDQDPRDADFGLMLAHRFGFSPEYVDVLSALAEATWHVRHEDAVDGLDRLRDPASVDVLLRVALSQHAYRHYDEAESLAVKCIWALYKIANVLAVERLAELMSSVRPILAFEAEARLTALGADPTRGLAHQKALEVLERHRRSAAR